jgi:hypothetical protein
MQTSFELKDDMTFVNDEEALLYFIKQNVVYDSGRVFMDFCRRFNHAVDIGFGAERALFIQGWRENPCIMVAHADTFWTFGAPSYRAFESFAYNAVEVSRGRIKGMSKRTGIGADDRAGIAIIWQLASLGHSILIADGEECGGLGAKHIAQRWDRWDEIQDRHAFCVEFDRRGAVDFKTYDVGTPAFDAYVSKSISRPIAEPLSFSDISFICTRIPGANLGVGYYNEHTPGEYVDISEWKSTLDTARKWLSEDLQSFRLKEDK